MLKIVYTPKGPAREYAALACNLYRGCTHGCTYCYAPAASHMKPEQYYATANPKKDAILRLEHDALRLAALRDCHEILLSFIGDPYQPAETQNRLTRQAIRILIKHNLPFTILTKGGTLARRDFDLLEGYPKARFGVSVNTIYSDDALKREPHAAPPIDRILSLHDAKHHGIRTWVSLEPVIDPDAALLLISFHHQVVDHWMIGKINHDKVLEDTVDWPAFKSEAEYTLKQRNSSYTFKRSILEACGGE